jgi:hypothetical protein
MLTRVLIALAAMTGPAAAPELSLPIACTPGTDCFIQQYVDRDKGPGVRDYACGAETYDGHEGTDIRLRTTAEVAKGVGVLASAPGTVIGVPTAWRIISCEQMPTARGSPPLNAAMACALTTAKAGSLNIAICARGRSR